ncbi:MAG: xylosidase, partial [Bacteroidales bacterium]
MKKIATLLIILISVSTIVVTAQNKHGQSTHYKSYKGLVMAGYQGWFRAEGDGSDSGWGHFGSAGKFDADHNTIDFWP